MRPDLRTACRVLAIVAAAALSPGVARAGTIYDNGPFVTHYGTGAGGANESVLQTGLGLTAYGFVHDAGTIDEIADDFTVPEGWEWTIEALTFFAYELNAPTEPTTLTTLCFMVLDGPPDTPGTHIIFGDFYTNRLSSSVWTGCFRVGQGQFESDDRPVMANTGAVDPPLMLVGGTYWIIWQTWGTQVSRAYAPPITILGQTDTGNGLVTEDGGYTYIPATDNHHQQGFPFLVHGTALDTPVERMSWGAVKALFR